MNKRRRLPLTPDHLQVLAEMDQKLPPEVQWELFHGPGGAKIRFYTGDRYLGGSGTCSELHYAVSLALSNLQHCHWSRETGWKIERDK